MSKKHDGEVLEELVSISPRANSKYVEDKVEYKEIAKLHRKEHIEKLIAVMYTEILKKKPRNIVDFICTEILQPGGPADALRKK